MCPFGIRVERIVPALPYLSHYLFLAQIFHVYIMLIFSLVDGRYRVPRLRVPPILSR